MLKKMLFTKHVADAKRFLVLMLMLSFFGCQSNEQKLRKFIEQFNQAAAKDLNNPTLTCEAEVISAEVARFTFRTNYEEGSIQEKMVQQTMEVMEQNLVSTGRFLRDLIKDGVNIDLVYKGKNGNIIGQKRIDKNNIDSLVSAAGSGKSNKAMSQNDVLHTLLDTWNKNMPMEDADSGLRILGIELDNEKALLYKIQYLDPQVEALINEETVPFLKDEALRNPAIQNVFNAVVSFGISKIKYHILSAQGEKLAEFVIERQDLLQ